jgi:hypothetical protein
MMKEFGAQKAKEYIYIDTRKDKDHLTQALLHLLDVEETA